MAKKGAPRTSVTERVVGNTSVPNIGVPAGIVLDCERGDIGKINFSTTPTNFEETIGRINPFEYGIGAYSGLNHLVDSGKLHWVRVDRGQTYPTGLVRTKINAMVTRNDALDILEAPIVDPIVKAAGSMTLSEIENYTFPEYATTREVASFAPTVALVRAPANGDTTLYVDNITPIKVGQQITLKDTTLIPQAQHNQYDLYTALSKERVLETQDFIKFSGTLAGITNNTEVKKVVSVAAPFTGVIQLSAAASIGDTVLAVTLGSGTWPITNGQFLKIAGSAVIYTVTANTPNTVIEVTPALDVAVSSGANVFKVTDQNLSYIPQVFAKELVSGTYDTVLVNNSDPIAEDDLIIINSVQGTVSLKFSQDNYVNKVVIDAEFANQTSATIGSEIFDVNVGDLIQRDAFLIYAANPGKWGNDLAISIRPHPLYDDAFTIDVYEKGVKEETFDVSRKHRLNGMGRQMYLEQVINKGSALIRVKDNLQHVDEDGVPIMPLFTNYYIRQPAPIPIYTQVSVTEETIWDGDSLVRIPAADISEINIAKPLRVGNSSYAISGLSSSVVSGPLDTVVLQSQIALGLDNLPASQRFLPVATPVYQQVAQQKEIKVVITIGTFPATALVVDTAFTIEINGTTFTRLATGQELTDLDLFQSLINQINGSNGAVVANYVPVQGLNPSYLSLKAQVPGIDFDYSVSATFTATQLKANVAEWNFQAPVRVNSAIVPNLVTNVLVSLVEGQFYIRDAGANRLGGGSDGPLPTLGQYIQALQLFRNRAKSDILVLLDAGLNIPAYAKEVDAIIQSRKDCVGFCATPYDVASSPNLQDVIDYRASLGLDSSWTALFNPWIKVYDSVMDTEIWLPVESDAARALARISQTSDKVWGSIAGWTNGKVSRALEVSNEYDIDQEGALYDVQVNNVRVDTAGRRAFFGQKTLEVDETPTNSLNVRMAALMIGRTLRAYLETVQFTINDTDTRQRHFDNAEDFMGRFKRENAVFDFIVICNESNNSQDVVESQEMYLDIGIKATRLAEYLFGRITITPSNKDFQLL